MKPYKGRKKRIKSFLFDTFVTIAFLFAFILIALQFGNPSAAGPERVDFSDYPIIAMEQYIFTATNHNRNTPLEYSDALSEVAAIRAEEAAEQMNLHDN